MVRKIFKKNSFDSVAIGHSGLLSVDLSIHMGRTKSSVSMQYFWRNGVIYQIPYSEMNAEIHPTPSLIPLRLEACSPKPQLILAGEIQRHSSFQTPFSIGFQLPADSAFKLPSLLILNRKQAPVFTSYRNAIRFLQVNSEKKKLIRLIQMKPLARPFYLGKLFLFNLLARLFPARSEVGSFLKTLRNKYE